VSSEDQPAHHLRDVFAVLLRQHTQRLRHVAGQPRIGGELHPVRHLVQTHPQPEIRRLHLQLTLDGDDVGIHQQQASTVLGGERIVLPEDAGGDESQHRAGLRTGEPSADEAAGPVRPAGHHPHRFGRRANPLPAVDDPRFWHGAVGVQTGHIPHRRFGRLGGTGQVVDRLTPGVLGGRWGRPGQPLTDGGREPPVHGAAHGQLPWRSPARRSRVQRVATRSGHVRHPQDHSVAARASIAVRPVGPASLEIKAKVSTRPL
jgi:hypothetical protein